MEPNSVQNHANNKDGTVLMPGSKRKVVWISHDSASAEYTDESPKKVCETFGAVAPGTNADVADV